MSTAHKVLVSILLVLEAVLALFGFWISFGFTAEYGDIAASRSGAFGDSWAGGILGLAVVLVGAFGLFAALVGRRRWITVVAVVLPALMVGAVWATGPTALQQKREVQYDATPQCDTDEFGSGPGADGTKAAQEVFDSIDHVGWFGGGGSSGADGCDRSMVLLETADVIAHYEATLRQNGWTIVAVGGGHLRAERESMAFEVRGQDRDWTVWAGPAGVAQGDD